MAKMAAKVRAPAGPVSAGKNVSAFAGRPRHKFYARPQELDGFRFDSKKEAEYYRKLKLRQAAGLIDESESPDLD